MNNTPSKTGIVQIIQKLLDYKKKVFANCLEMERLQNENEELSKKVVDSCSSPAEIEWRNRSSDNWRKELNRRVWRRLVFLLHLERYMLCSEYDKLQEQIEKNQIPEFETTTVTLWVENLKSLIYENMEKLVKEVFKTITETTYKTSKSYNAPKKKRNNNGVDKYFILQTADRGWTAGWWKPTITDDIEKVIYLLAGEPVPAKTLRHRMDDEKVFSGETPYFRVKCCQNHNTHYWITDTRILEKLNLIGSDKR